MSVAVLFHQARWPDRATDVGGDPTADRVRAVVRRFVSGEASTFGDAAYLGPDLAFGPKERTALHAALAETFYYVDASEFESCATVGDLIAEVKTEMWLEKAAVDSLSAPPVADCSAAPPIFNDRAAADFDFRLDRAARNVAMAAAALIGVVALVLAGVDMHLGLAFVVLGGLLTTRAMAFQRRCDAYHAGRLEGCFEVVFGGPPVSARPALVGMESGQ